MSDVNHYCNICGGPLSSLFLRRASLADEGDNVALCHDDSCNCGGSAGADPEDSDTDVESDASDEPYHAEYCASLTGYNSSTLLEKGIRWLDRARMIRLQTDISGDKKEDVYLSNIGSYCSTVQGLQFPGTGQDSMHPDGDSFLVHDHCITLLFFICKITPELYPPVTLKQVFLTMQALSRTSRETVIDWNDRRVYGGSVRDFQHMDRWEAQHGHEWLVADPVTPVDFPLLIIQASHENMVKAQSPIWGPETPRSRPRDCFHHLPLEIRHRIIQFLPSPSVVNLSIASPSFHIATRYLPNDFWKSRLDHHYRWLQGTPLYQILDTVRHPINYFALLHFLNEVSAPRSDGDFSVLGQHIWFGFRNWRRIWTCCEGVLDKVCIHHNSGPVPQNRTAVVASASTSTPTHISSSSPISSPPRCAGSERVYVPLNDVAKKLVLIRAFFPLGEKKQLGGFMFVFSDGSQQVVGVAENHENVKNSISDTVVFDVASQETVVGMACYFNGLPTLLHGVQFYTSKYRTLSLGFINPWGEAFRQQKLLGAGERVAGFRIEVKIPLIEGIEFVLVDAA